MIALKNPDELSSGKKLYFVCFLNLIFLNNSITLSVGSFILYGTKVLSKSNKIHLIPFLH